jgi:signal transduction histidine kinase/CheY-like chemotaxis protein
MNTPKVLLVDDNDYYRSSLVQLLRNEPYSFVEATSPEEGIAALEAHQDLRVILLDLSFKNGGPQAETVVLEHLKNRADCYRVIVLTGHDELLAAERAREYSVFNYLPKAERSSEQAIRFSLRQAFKDLERVALDRRVHLLLEVQQRLSAGRNLEETLDFICMAVRTSVGAYTCHLRVYDFMGGDYHLKGFSGSNQRMRSVFERPRRKGELFSGRVVESGEDEVLDDLQNREEFRRFAAAALAARNATLEEEEYWRTVQSAYLVPIKTATFEPAVDAVLNVSSDSTGYFLPDKCALVQEFAALAALAITKHWLQTKRLEIHQDYSQISAMLSEMSASLKGTEVLAGIYGVVTRRIAEIVNAEVVSIFIYDDAREQLENVAELSGNVQVQSPNEVYRPWQSLTGSVFAGGEPIQLPDPAIAPRVRPTEDSRYDHANKEGYLRRIPSGELEHYLAVPIRIGGSIRGVLRAMNKKSRYYDQAMAGGDGLCLLERGFSADCRNALVITASHLAVAIRNAELLKEKDRQVDKTRSLAAVGRLIGSALQLDQLLKLTIEQMAEVMQAEICMLFLRDEDRIVLKQCIGMPIIAAAEYKIGEGLTGLVAQNRKNCLMATTDDNRGKYDAIITAFLGEKHGPRSRIESLMVVPVIAKDTVLGAMKVINKVGDHYQYGESDLELFRAFADYVGVAIYNAQIYKGANDRLAIAERNATLSSLVSAVGHEINNTSALIPTNVAAIRAELGTSSTTVDEMLDLIEDAAGQASEFANELAGFAGKWTSKKEALDVNIVVGAAMKSLGADRQRYEKGGAVIVNISPSPQPLICELYRTPFIQIVKNIVINAFQALEGRRQGIIQVSTALSDGDANGTATVEIVDNGPGIKAKDIGRIFEPGFSTKSKGTGVGLWLVRTHLELLGGSITVESKPGKGARFIVRIPLAERAEGGRQDETSDPSLDR